MSAKFYTLLTEIGAAKLASAAALGVPLKITQMAVGDGGGVLPTPSAQQTALVAEKRRASLNMLYIDPQNSSQVIAEQVIPETEGGWWIREVGLFDDTGALIAVGNCPESYKPQLAEGSGRTQTVRMVLITSSTENITLKIDPAVVLATRKYVDDKVLELKVYVDDLMAKHLAAADPHTQYAPKNSPILTGTPETPTAPAGNNTRQIASTAFVQAAIAALVGSSPAALDTLNEFAAALGNDPNFASTMLNALAGKQPLNPTLTALSGKDAAGILAYLGLPTLITGNPPDALNTLERLAAAIGNDANFSTSLSVILANKQTRDETLTGISGKTPAQIAVYIGALRQSQNLADIPNAETARANLGVPAGVDAQMPFAWCKFDGRTGLIHRQHNISSVIKDGAGQYAFNFIRQAATADYCVTGSSSNAGAAIDAVARVFCAADRLKSGFNVISFDNNTDTYADGIIDVCVLGG